MKRGVFIAEDGKGVDQRLQYDSTREHLQVNLAREPFHLDIVNFPGGTDFAATIAGGTVDRKETLFAVEHNLPYTPDVMFFCYVESYNGSATDPKAGYYFSDKLTLTGAIFVFDGFYAEVDEKEFRIVHRHRTDPATDHTSDASKYSMRLKYYIISRDAGVDSYNTSGLLY